MPTRKQYMNKECTHREFYAQFAGPGVKGRVLALIGIERLQSSTDEHLNDIPLKTWDALGPVGSVAQWQAAEDSPTMAGRTCIYKEAARQILEDAAESSQSNVAKAAEATRNLPDGWKIGEPLSDNRWRVNHRGTIVNSAPTLEEALKLANRYARGGKVRD